mgnify:CR=1 FL=1
MMPWTCTAPHASTLSSVCTSVERYVHICIYIYVCVHVLLAHSLLADGVLHSPQVMFCVLRRGDQSALIRWLGVEATPSPEQQQFSMELDWSLLLPVGFFL